MEGGSIALCPGQRKRLLALYRKEPDPLVRLRAHIVLLPADGHPWSLVCAVLFCSTATVARWRDRFERGGVEALAGGRRGRRPLLARWAVLLVVWVKTLTPRDFGYCRSRWCCATLAVVPWDVHRVKLSDETVRRLLHGRGMVWRRPRPVPGRTDPHGAWKLRKVRHLDDLRRAFRHYRVIHVICDNARFHTAGGSRLVRQYLREHGDRVVLHYLPAYSPKDNPAERVWWHLHEEITRNHRCGEIGELVDLTLAWLDERGPFKIQGRMYERLRGAA